MIKNEIIKRVEAMNSAEAELVLLWLMLFASESPEFNQSRTSYGLKHDVERYFDVYINHDTFKAVADLIAESKPAFPKQPEHPNKVYKFEINLKSK